MKSLLFGLLIVSMAFAETDEKSKILYRNSKYRVAANLTVETVGWLGLFFVLPDAKDYRELWPKGGVFSDGVKFAYSDGNSGFFEDKIGHPFLGSTIYGFLEESGYHPIEALTLTCVHSVLWEFKEYPKTRNVEMKDAVWTMVPSGLYCLGDILANETNNRILQIIGNILSSPSHTGKFIYKYSLGLMENRK